MDWLPYAIALVVLIGAYAFYSSSGMPLNTLYLNHRD